MKFETRLSKHVETETSGHYGQGLQEGVIAKWHEGIRVMQMFYLLIVVAYLLKCVEPET